MNKDKSESRHLRLKLDLLARIRRLMEEENRTFNNACETLLYEAIARWEARGAKERVSHG